MFMFRTFIRTVNCALRCATSKASLAALTLLASGGNVAWAQSAEDLDVLRVDIPLTQQSYSGGELAISQLISDNTYIDVEDFNLRAVEIEAYSPNEGKVRLKVGRYLTPPVPLPGQSEQGLLRIEAPHKTNKTWRLLIDERVNITALTAVLEPRSDNLAYYETRYQQRGYAFGQDPYDRQSLRDTWLLNDTNRSASHFLWLNDARGRFQLNPSYGNTHRHSRDCFDRYGRHLALGRSVRQEQNTARRRTYLHQRIRARERGTRSLNERQRSTGRATQERRSATARRNAEQNRVQRARSAPRSQTQSRRSPGESNTPQHQD